MARITEEYIQSAFYRCFYRMTTAEQTGIIRGLEAVRACSNEAQRGSSTDGPLFEEEATTTDKDP